IDGRRLAKPPRAWRICRRPASGRLSGGRALNWLSPTAPRRTASESSAASRVVVGRGEPVWVMATPPMRPSTKMKSWPPNSATARRMLVACWVTSGPMPSPARTAILRRITLSLCSSTSMRGDGGLVGLKKAEEVLVVDGFLAVGEFGEAVVDVVEPLASEGVAELFEAICEGAAAGVFAEDKIGVGYAYGGWCHDLVGERVRHHAVLVNAGLVGEGVGSDDGLVGRAAEADDFGEHLAGGVELGHVDVVGVGELVAADHEDGGDLLEGADAVDGALDLAGSTLDAGDGVCDGHTEVVVAVGGEDDVVDARDAGFDHAEDGG